MLHNKLPPNITLIERFTRANTVMVDGLESHVVLEVKLEKGFFYRIGDIDELHAKSMICVGEGNQSALVDIFLTSKEGNYLVPYISRAPIKPNDGFMIPTEYSPILSGDNNSVVIRAQTRKVMTDDGNKAFATVTANLCFYKFLIEGK